MSTETDLQTITNAAHAAWDFYKAHQQVERVLGKRKNITVRERDTAVAKLMLQAYALHDALELTPGEWEHDDIPAMLAVAEGKISMEDLMSQAVRHEQMQRLFSEAVLHDEHGAILDMDGVEHGDYLVTVLRGWTDSEGRPHLQLDMRPAHEEGEQSVE